jgi:hypothetical protein
VQHVESVRALDDLNQISVAVLSDAHEKAISCTFRCDPIEETHQPTISVGFHGQLRDASSRVHISTLDASPLPPYWGAFGARMPT